MDGRTDDGRKVITIAHPEQSSGELINVIQHCKERLYLLEITVVNQQYLDRQACANSVDPDEMLQNAASHQVPLCLSPVQQFLDNNRQ